MPPTGSPQVANRLLTGVEQGHMWGRFNRRLAQDREFFELVLKLKVRVTALEEQITALEAGHERLRGKLYQSGAHKPPEAAPEAPRSKGEILRDYFVPGRPAKHSE